jgi:hypothetical protein
MINNMIKSKNNDEAGDGEEYEEEGEEEENYQDHFQDEDHYNGY